MTKTVLITGSSSGIGKEFAKIFAKKGDNVILVARSEDKLKEIKNHLNKKYGSNVIYYVKDLTAENSVKELYDVVTSDGYQVDYLINNAGFGSNHAYIDTDYKIHEDMVKLNILSLMELCHCFGKDMCEQKSGKILNVASIAAFSAGPYMSVYYASKAFVLSFSEALAEEFSAHGVSVTCLCPGPTETNFGTVSDFGKSNAFRYLGVAKASDVAKIGYKAMMKEKSLALCGFKIKFMAFLTRITPRSINTKFSKLMNMHK